jgi:hypothetical protein
VSTLQADLPTLASLLSELLGLLTVFAFSTMSQSVSVSGFAEDSQLFQAHFHAASDHRMSPFQDLFVHRQRTSYYC